MKKLYLLGLFLSVLLSGCALNGQHQMQYAQDPVFINDDWQNGTYDGNYKDGLRSGQGTYVNSRGDQYIGAWYKDRPLFYKSKIVFKNGTTLEVKSANRHFSSYRYLLEEAVLTWPGGQRYEGSLSLRKSEFSDRSSVHLLMDDIELHEGTLFVDDKAYEVPEGTRFESKLYQDDFIAKTDNLKITHALTDRRVSGVFQAELFNHKIIPYQEVYYNSKDSYSVTFEQPITVFYNTGHTRFPKSVTYEGKINQNFKMTDGVLTIPTWGHIIVESGGEYFETGDGPTLARIKHTQGAIEQLYQQGLEQYTPEKTINCKAYDGSWIVKAGSQCKGGYVHGKASIMKGDWSGAYGDIYFLTGTFDRGMIVEGRYEIKTVSDSTYKEYLPFQAFSSTSFEATFAPHTLDTNPFSLVYHNASGTGKYYRNDQLVFEGEHKGGNPVKGKCLRPFTNDPKKLFVPGDCTFKYGGRRNDANYLTALKNRNEARRQARIQAKQQREREAAERKKAYEQAKAEAERKRREEARLAEEEQRRFLEREPEQTAIAKAFSGLGDSAQRFNAESQRIREQNKRIMSGYHDIRNTAIKQQANREAQRAAAQKKRVTSTTSSSPYGSYNVDTSKPRYTKPSSSKPTASDYKKSSTPKPKTVAKPSKGEQPAKTKEALAFCWQSSERQKTKDLWLCDGKKQQILLAEPLNEALEAVGCDNYRKKMPYDNGFLYLCGYNLGSGATDKLTWNRDIRKWRGISRY